MKISDMVRELNRIKKEHGDLEAFVIDGNSTQQGEVVSVSSGQPLRADDPQEAYVHIDSGPYCGSCGRGCD